MSPPPSATNEGLSESKPASGSGLGADGCEEATLQQRRWTPGRPNVLVTGTPGVGKTYLCGLLALELGLRHIEVGAFAKERELLAEHDAEHDAYYMHEDAVLDELEGLMSDGGIVLDHHSCDWFPERWFQVAVVLHARTDVLYDRLTIGRGYSGTKLNANMEAEIMQVVAEEAVESYSKVEVLRLQNNDEAECKANVTVIKKAYRRVERPDSLLVEDVVH